MTPGHLFGNQRGATLMVVLVMVVITGLAAGMAGTSWKTVMQRAREEGLLWRGDQYRRAIQSYYNVKQGGIQKYPRKLEDLLKDARSLQTVRHIRRLYPDPMTGEDWVIIKAPGSGIKGVRSSSSGVPFKTADFPEEYEDFMGKSSYSEWEFTYVPESKKKTEKTGGAADSK